MKTVDKIVASFTKTIRDLDATATKLGKQAHDDRNKAQRLVFGASAKEAELQRARRIIENLEGIVA